MYVCHAYSTHFGAVGSLSLVISLPCFYAGTFSFLRTFIFSIECSMDAYPQPCSKPAFARAPMPSLPLTTTHIKTTPPSSPPSLTQVNTPPAFPLSLTYINTPPSLVDAQPCSIRAWAPATLTLLPLHTYAQSHKSLPPPHICSLAHSLPPRTGAGPQPCSRQALAHEMLSLPYQPLPSTPASTHTHAHLNHSCRPKTLQ